MCINILHEGVVEVDRHVQIGDARVAGHGNGRGHHARDGRNRLRHVGGGVGGASARRAHARNHGGAQVVGGVRTEAGGDDRIHVDEIGARILDGEEECFGVRVARRCAGVGVVREQDLVGWRIAEQAEPEPAIPDAGIAFRIHVQAQEHAVACVQCDAVEIRFAGRDGADRARDVAGSGQRSRCRRGVVRFGFRGRCGALPGEIQVVGADHAGSDVVPDTQVVGAGRGDRCAGDGGRTGVERAVVVVAFDHRGAVAVDQVEHAVAGCGCVPQCLRRGVDAVAGGSGERVEIHVVRRVHVAGDLGRGGGNRSRLRECTVRFDFERACGVAQRGPRNRADERCRLFSWGRRRRRNVFDQFICWRRSRLRGGHIHKHARHRADGGDQPTSLHIRPPRKSKLPSSYRRAGRLECRAGGDTTPVSFAPTGAFDGCLMGV